jgi:hypothetical protein
VFTLILPFHADGDRLTASLRRIEAERDRWRIGEVLLCHNGPAWGGVDPASWAATLPLGSTLLHTDRKGIGAGYRIGIAQAGGEYVVLTASDLPFGFTDVGAFLALSEPRPALAIGSKAHPCSRIPRGGARRLAAAAFRLWRRLLLGRATPGDSQGTIIVRTAVARAIVTEVVEDGYLFSLELITQCLARGESIVELPVTLEPREGPSSVSLGLEAWRMGRGVWRLSRRIRRIARAA